MYSLIFLQKSCQVCFSIYMVQKHLGACPLANATNPLCLTRRHCRVEERNHNIEGMLDSSLCLLNIFWLLIASLTLMMTLTLGTNNPDTLLCSLKLCLMFKCLKPLVPFYHEILLNNTKELLRHAATWMNIRRVMLSEKIQTQMLHTLWFHLNATFEMVDL